MKLDKRSKIFIIVFFSIIFVPVIIIGTINYSKEQEDTSHWMPKDIYEELVKLNGEPDEIELKSDKLGTDYYTWYGKNGILTMCDDNISKNIEVHFEIEEQ